jgi:hypothetical protein
MSPIAETGHSLDRLDGRRDDSGFGPVRVAALAIESRK